MWSSIAGLFGSGKTVEKGLDMVSNGLDALVFTDQEKTVANQKVLDWKLKWIAATGPQSVARRVISYVIVGLWSYIVLLAVHFHLLGFTKEAEFLFKVLSNVLHWPFITIIGFYFAAHIVRANKK
jgi:hypothetical protein